MSLRTTFRHVERHPFSSFCAGLLAGFLLDIWPMVVIPLLLVALLAVIFQAVRSGRRSPGLTRREEAILEPDAYAELHCSESGDVYLVAGACVELIAHPSIATRTSLDQLGWAPEDVELVFRQEEFDARDALAYAGGKKDFDLPNGKKFCLVGTSLVMRDSPRLVLQLASTDYFTIRSARAAFDDNPLARYEYGNIDPKKNRTPHSLCLHFVVRFADGGLLAMRRDSRISWCPNLWSFSAEEQLHEDDLKTGQPINSWLRRSFCEEVIGWHKESDLDVSERWQSVGTLVRQARILSLFFEERFNNFSLLGVIQLDVGVDEYVKHHSNLVRRGEGFRDREGMLFHVGLDNAKCLLTRSECKAQKLLGTPHTETIVSRALHLSSRYRLFRVLRAILGSIEVDASTAWQ